jgi:N-acetylneuraminate synthase
MKLVAEIGINHNGELEIAKSLIDQTKAAGWDYVKFQKRNVRKVIPKDKWQDPKQTPWGILTYIDYKERLEFGNYEYEEIDKHCQMHRLEWFASLWDKDSVTFLTQWECPYIKVASASLTDLELLDNIEQTEIPIIVSTGMADYDIFMKAFDVLNRHNRVEYILACTSTYPSKPEEQNLSFIKELYEKFLHQRIGFSNHSPGIVFAAAAVLYGAEMIECHVTLDRAMFGSDQAASIEPEGMHKLKKYAYSLKEAIGPGTWMFYDSEREIAQKLRVK